MEAALIGIHQEVTLDHIAELVFDRVHPEEEFQLLENFELVQLQHTDIHQQ